MGTGTLVFTSLMSSAQALSLDAAHQGSNVMDGIVDRLTNPQKYNLNAGEWQEHTCGNFDYSPVGSPSAERRMCEGAQAVGIMARPLLQPVICDESCAQDIGMASQLRMGTNSITVLRNNGAQDNNCDTKLGGEDWERVTRTIYAGADGSGSIEACSAPERVALLNQWSSLWADGCAEPSPCGQVHHLFRPDERSGMGQLFAFFLGIQNYCNGGAQDDNDPIRRPCREDERYCPNGKDLGVVLPVKIPFPANPDPSYFAGINKTSRCALGNFGFAFADSTSFTRCPDGTTPFAGFLCLYPRDANGVFGCNNDQYNTSGFDPFMDARVYNEIPLSSLAQELFPAGTELSDWREYYRIHADCPNGGHENSELLGCIVSQSQCSLGWGAMPIQAQTQANPQVAITKLGDAGIDQADYPLNQSLYLNTLSGFDSAIGEEAKLVDCIKNHPEWVVAAVEDAGFIPSQEPSERPVTCFGRIPQ